MLARENRVRRADDFRAAVRRGVRVTTPHAVLYLRKRHDDEPTRYGIIVTKSIGTAVERNLVRRRIRSVGRRLLDASTVGRDIVIRALPGSAEASWVTLHDEILEGLERGARKG